MSDWKKKRLCDLTIEDVLQAHKEGYCFPVNDGKYIYFFDDESSDSDIGGGMYERI